MFTLSLDELDQLAYAVDHGTPVRIRYRSNSGALTDRIVTPQLFRHRWIECWCHQHGDVRDFTMASIRGVAPPREY